MLEFESDKTLQPRKLVFFFKFNGSQSLLLVSIYGCSCLFTSYKRVVDQPRTN